MKRAAKRAPQHLLPKTISSLVLLLLLFIGGLWKSGLIGDSPAGRTPDSPTSVHFLDVGQGDSILILSGAEAVLVDAGTPSSAQTIISYLESQGVTHLRAAVATHPHADHIGSMGEVLERFGADTLYLPDKTATTQSYSRMLDAVESGDITAVVPAPGDVLTLQSGALLRFYSPDPAETFDDVNNYSLVARFEAGKSRVLLTGDAEAPVEKALAASGADLSCTVLKVGHHGSKTSSTPAFLNRLGATTAIISCGAGNQYGHPDPETLAALEEAGFTSILRTDEYGTIVIDCPTVSQPATTQIKEDAA